jgi:hypothetical protein
MRNATSIWLFGASSLVLVLGACGGGGSDDGRDDGTSGKGTTTAGTSSTAGTPGAAGSGTTTAGNSSTAGTAGTSAGGAPACNPVAGSKKGDGTNMVIDDIDDMNTTFAPAGSMATGSWDWGKDTMGMGTITPTGTMTLMPVAGGHMGNALHVTGAAVTGWGASLAAFLNGATGSFDASDYGGVAFWIKGTTNVLEGANKLLIQARMPDVLPGPGTCCSDAMPGNGLECYSGHRAAINVTADWSEVRIAWADFKGPSYGLGSTLTFNPNRIRDINFSFNHDAAGAAIDFDVWVDGLRFLSKTETSNIGGGSGGSSSGGSASGGSGGSGGSAAGSGGGGTGGTGGTN